MTWPILTPEKIFLFEYCKKELIDAKQNASPRLDLV